MSLQTIKTTYDTPVVGDYGVRVYQSTVRCPANAPKVPEGWGLYYCGGAYPYFIVYDPEAIRVVWLSTRGTVEELPHLEQLPEFITSVPASVHGCWKLKKNQYVAVLRR